MTGIVGLALLLLFVGAAGFGATALRLTSLHATLLAGYLLLSAAIIVSLNLLSLVRAVHRVELATLGAFAFLTTLVVWLAVGRPRPPLRGRRPDVKNDPLLMFLGTAVVAALSFEAFLVVTAVPNTWDSLTYHLPRVAAWYQHGGVYWINNATGRQNEFPPGAELLVLFCVILSAGDRLVEAPQFIAELALLVGIYGVGRRIGVGRPAAMFAALLFACLSNVALESTTTQTDLVVTSFLIAAAFFTVGDKNADFALSGLALGLAVATKQSALFALPGMVVLALPLPRRSRAIVGMCWLAGVGVIGSWGYVRNVSATGHILGFGSGRLEHQADPGLASVATVARIAFRFIDVSGFSPTVVAWLGLAGVAGTAVFLAHSYTRSGRELDRRLAVVSAFAFAGPLALVLVAGAIGTIATASGLRMYPAATSSGPPQWGINGAANEDLSYFGPLGALLLIPVVVGTLTSKRTDVSRLPKGRALALMLPLYAITLALIYRFNPFVGRFMIIPVAFIAPLVASVHRQGRLAPAVVVLAVTSLVLVHGNNQLKPLHGPSIWHLDRSRAYALTQNGGKNLGRASEQLDQLIPSEEKLGALLGTDDAAYPLFGAHMQRRVVYLAPSNAVLEAVELRLQTVLIGPNRSAAPFRADPYWSVTLLGGSYWRLARYRSPYRPKQSRGAASSRRVRGSRTRVAPVDASRATIRPRIRNLQLART